MEKPGERNELAGARRKRSGNNEEGESELKARKPCVGKRREHGKRMGERRSEKIIEDEKKRPGDKETERERDVHFEGQCEISASVNERAERLAE